MRCVLLLLTMLALAACPWRGVDDLVDDADLVVVLTGVVAGDAVVLEVGGRRTRASVRPGSAGELRLFVELDAGTHRAELRHERGDEVRCASFEVQPASGDVATYALDARLMERCEDDDDEEQDDGGAADGDEPDAADAGEDDEEQDADAGDDDDDRDAGPPETRFVWLSEVAPADGCSGNCDDEHTEIEADGSVSYDPADGEELEGTLSPAELAVVVQDSLSSAADALFAGGDPGCPVGQPSDETVELERRLLLLEGGDETYLTERVDVSDCDGIALTLRQHLATARERALSSGP